MADYKLEIYKDKRGEFRWRRTAENGEIVGASSESYKAKKDCEANANRDTGADRSRWEADAVVAEEIHTALVAAREEARHRRRRRPDLVGLELAERLALDRLECDDYEDLLVAWAERELAGRGPVATGRDDRDVIALDDLAAVELARAELDEAIAAWHALDEEPAPPPT